MFFFFFFFFEIAGYGQEKGSLVTKLYNNHWQSIDVILLENIPWYLSVYLHSLKIIRNGEIVEPCESINK